MTSEEKEIAKLDMQIQIDRAKAKVNEHKKLVLEYMRKAKEHESNIPLAEELVVKLEQDIKQLG